MLNRCIRESRLTRIEVLYIPVCLIWKIQIKWSQKAALTFSLCPTVIMILVTTTRASGMKLDGHIDQVWMTCWLILSAEVGIILTSIAAFRACFVARNSKIDRRVIRSTGERIHWYHDKKHLFEQAFIPSLRRSKT